MLKIKEVIIVEGRYDKATLANLVDGLILTTDGFQIFRDREKRAMLRQLAETRGVIVLTDADGGGLLIRNHLKGVLPPEQVKHAYIPPRPGKERRKAKPGRAGLLGVEGMSQNILETALRRAGATILDEGPPAAVSHPITRTDLYRLGLSGGANSREKRRVLCRRLELPEQLSAKSLAEVLGSLMTLEELSRLTAELEDV